MVFIARAQLASLLVAAMAMSCGGSTPIENQIFDKVVRIQEEGDNVIQSTSVLAVCEEKLFISDVRTGQLYAVNYHTGEIDTTITLPSTIADEVAQKLSQRAEQPYVFLLSSVASGIPALGFVDGVSPSSFKPKIHVAVTDSLSGKLTLACKVSVPAVDLNEENPTWVPVTVAVSMDCRDYSIDSLVVLHDIDDRRVQSTMFGINEGQMYAAVINPEMHRSGDLDSIPVLQKFNEDGSPKGPPLYMKGSNAREYGYQGVFGSIVPIGSNQFVFTSQRNPTLYMFHRSATVVEAYDIVALLPEDLQFERDSIVIVGSPALVRTGVVRVLLKQKTGAGLESCFVTLSVGQNEVSCESVIRTPKSYMPGLEASATGADGQQTMLTILYTRSEGYSIGHCKLLENTP